MQAPKDAVDEGKPAGTIFGQPVALTFGIGEAF
jgi:hypothetical protein